MTTREGLHRALDYIMDRQERHFALDALLHDARCTML